MDMFAPVSLRIHPLTRISFSPSTTNPATAPANSPLPTLQARLELTDQFNDTGKTVGLVNLDIHEYQLLLPHHRGSRLSRFTLDLSSPTTNQQFWDPITRTYFFKIPLHPDAAKILAATNYHLTLAATLTLPNGEVLSSHLILTPK